MSSYVVFCDESSYTNQPKRHFLCIGSLWVPQDDKAKFTQQIKNIKRERGLRGEVKWSKVSSMCLEGYKELADLFIAQDSMRFRVIVVDLEKVRFDEFHEGDTELGFYKFYYHMLYQWLEDGNEYLVLLDFKSNKGARRFADLRNALANKTKGVAIIKDLTVIDSRESHLLQLCDLLTGAVAAAHNRDIRPGSPKKLLENHIAAALGWPNLECCTEKTYWKFNVFRIRLD